jgi:hypothetical protein
VRPRQAARNPRRHLLAEDGGADRILAAVLSQRQLSNQQTLVGLFAVSRGTIHNAICDACSYLKKRPHRYPNKRLLPHCSRPRPNSNRTRIVALDLYGFNDCAICSPKASKSSQQCWVSLIGTTFDQPDAAPLQAKLPAVAAHLTDAREDVLTFTAMRREAQRQVWGSNPQERFNKGFAEGPISLHLPRPWLHYPAAPAPCSWSQTMSGRSTALDGSQKPSPGQRLSPQRHPPPHRESWTPSRQSAHNVNPNHRSAVSYTMITGAAQKPQLDTRADPPRVGLGLRATRTRLIQILTLDTQTLVGISSPQR